LLGTRINGQIYLFVDGVLAGGPSADASNFTTGGVAIGNFGVAFGAFAWPGSCADAVLWMGMGITATLAALDFRLSNIGYRVPDSPLRWISTRTWFVPARTGGLLMKRRRAAA
jgi:hypothetical protein